VNRKLKTITLKLFDYCRESDWAGFDPYDALNSELFKRLPFLDFWLPRLAMTQILKRSPINFRPLLMIPKTQNPKALALFLMAFLKLSQNEQFDQENNLTMIVERIKTLRSPDTAYWCWGYSFPWQGRSVLAPRGEPNLVCTVFVANALTDIYEKNQATDCLTMATSAADYLLNELYWSEGDNAGFSYPLPSFQTRVHNANFLGAALLCRIYKHTGEKKYLEPALKAARYSASMQHPDGSWNYGEHETQQWVDNFHTGYNLCALRNISRYMKINEFEPHIRRGFKFYRNHFFREDGAPKYFHNKVYPIDVHSVAQSIITLLEFSDLDQGSVSLAHRVFEWAVNNMWNNQGYFYYQVTPYYKNKISYMRWSQAWMLLALATLLTHNKSTS
jgi:hypothetical protein